MAAHSAFSLPPMSRLALALSLAATMLGAFVGCSRQLNDRTDYEHAQAVDFHRTQGQYDLKNGRVVDAYSHFAEALRIDPDDAGSHWGMGRLFLAAGHISEADESFARARALDPDYRAQTPEPVPVDKPQVAAALIARRPPPSDADWIAGQAPKSNEP